MGPVRSPELWLPFGHPGAWMAVVATLHVLASHSFALGGFTLVAAWLGLPEGTRPEALIRRLARWALAGASTVGALSGVWTWFTAMLIQPLGTALLLRRFFWVWFLEWGVFLAEMALAFLLVHALERGWALDRQRQVAWALLGSSWLTMILISGILGAMLSPSAPEATAFGALWTATWGPQILVRSGLALLLGGCLGGLAIAAWAPEAKAPEARAWALGAWGLALLGLGGLGYASAWPPHATALLPWLWRWSGGWGLMGALALGFGAWAAWGLGLRGQAGPSAWQGRGGLALGSLALALVLTASFERVREQGRKPFLLPGLAYAHGLPLAWQAPIEGGESYLAWAASEPHDLATPQGQRRAGEALFARQCWACHAPGGPRDPLPALSGLPASEIELLLMALPAKHPAMPPFVGQAAERRALAAWLQAMAKEAQGRPPQVLKAPPPPPSSFLGGAKALPRRAS